MKVLLKQTNLVFAKFKERIFVTPTISNANYGCSHTQWGYYFGKITNAYYPMFLVKCAVQAGHTYVLKGVIPAQDSVYSYLLSTTNKSLEEMNSLSGNYVEVAGGFGYPSEETSSGVGVQIVEKTISVTKDGFCYFPIQQATKDKWKESWYLEDITNV